MRTKRIPWLLWLVEGIVPTSAETYALNVIPPSPPQVPVNGGLLEFDFDQDSLLSPRQVCAPPRGLCSNNGYCGLSTEGDCCGRSQCLRSDGFPQCCQNSHCIADDAQCCPTFGWWCPSPFLCGTVTYLRNNVPITSFPACCENSACTKWLDGTTLASFATAATNGVNTRTTTTVNAGATTAIRSTDTTTDVTPTSVASLRLYTTWIVMSYRSQFYTLRTNGLNGGNSTSRTVTTLYTTTTISVSATGTAAANLAFLSSSMALIEPTDITVPITPTPGALIQGACTTTAAAQTSDVICQTLTVDGGWWTGATPSTDSGPRSAASSLLCDSLVIWALCSLFVVSVLVFIM